MVRMFFAILPGPSVRKQLSHLVKIIHDGRSVLASNLHMTLHFIGNTDQTTCLIEQAQQIRCKPFILTIDQFGFFKRTQVGWVGPSVYPSSLIELASQCAKATEHCGHGLNNETFTPHVTLARKLKHQPEFTEFQPITWSVDSFDLMISESHQTGVRYRSTGYFKLR